MSERLLPTGSSALEIAAAEALASPGAMSVPLRQLWIPQTCPVHFCLIWRGRGRLTAGIQPGLNRQSAPWCRPRSTCTGTKARSGAIRRVVEPLGYLIRVIEWWKTNEAPGTFRLDVGVLDTGITEEMYNELERLIADAKPCSRHLIGLSINLDANGTLPVAVASYSGDELTVYPYTPELISAGGPVYSGAAVHLIDLTEVSA